MTDNALKGEWQCLTSKIITTVEIHDPLRPQKIEVKALWDTGSERSSITQKVVNSLNLGTIGYIKVNSIHGSIPRARVVKVRIKLPNIDIQEIITPTVFDLVKGIELVIGDGYYEAGGCSHQQRCKENTVHFCHAPF